MRKRYNTTGTIVNANGDREEVTIIPVGANRRAIAEIEESNGRVWLPTAADRAAAEQREATYIDEDELDYID